MRHLYDVWSPELFAGRRDDLRRMMGLLLQVPELREPLEDVTGGTSPDGAHSNIVEAKDEGEDVVVWGSSGALRLRYQDLVLRFDDGTPLALAALDESARASWEDWDRDVRQPALSKKGDAR